MSAQIRSTDSAFDLPRDLAGKAVPSLIADDEQFFARVAASLARSTADLVARLDFTRKAPVELGQEALERDMEVHRLNARIRTLRRYGLDLCLGHIVRSDCDAPSYIGRLGLLDTSGEQLLIDWRSPAAEPFFGATHAHPMGLDRRRRYCWTAGKISDYWDEVFDAGSLDDVREAALDDQSAFIASLGGTRSPRMRDVLGTIQADQDAIIRAGSSGALVVDGGPGTGKTVVALHRTAYLLYSDPRLGHNNGGVLFVGPHQPYLAYVSDVLPSLGEEGVRTCTLADLVDEGGHAAAEADSAVAHLKSSAQMIDVVDAAVRFYEQPPTRGMAVDTEWADIWSSPEDWKESFEARDPGVPHNLAREQIWSALIDILVDKYVGAETTAMVRKSLQDNEDLRTALDDSWTLVEAADLVGDLWTVPAYLRKCAPWLTSDEVRLLQRPDAHAWTKPDLPLLDAARARLGDPDAARRQRRRTASIEAERRRMDRVVDELLQLDDEDGLMAQLRQDGIRDALVDHAVLPSVEPDRLAGPFAHIVVDEAQELTDAEWQMLLSRCPSGSFTIVGDRAQARHGFTETWHERLERVGLSRIEMASLRINYRTPTEIMTAAEPVIRAALPDANVPTSIRSSGVPVTYGHVSELDSIVDDWLAHNSDGIGCVIGHSEFHATNRMRSLAPELSKGLEFDLVVVVEPESFGTGIEGAVDRYVAMTRATQRLVVLTYE
ncbi:RNA polymerase recycling motor ATPase HelR [Rhodococcoides kyotonense]|uniref:DNA helicase IV n=1 Tax=Rhodococcoides kyotonense TaxID=398843 RepID=A0A239CGN2_9NOCA|nr:RNA polymerase recycling motor ATPase HelR [Rhodococcus kyotonensis]SNS19260.1 DNA helicase IV [Rhodococcus kyotonensis]